MIAWASVCTTVTRARGASEATKGIAQVGMQSEVPVTFGVLTTETIEQAIERAGTKMGNKGVEAALAAIEMVNLYQSLARAEV